MELNIGADIGGTFTDLVVMSQDGQTFESGKILTTPHQPDDAVIEGLRKLIDTAKIDVNAIKNVVHGTTLFANALIERKGSRVALVTTRGFRDAIDIGREHRYDIYDLHICRPKPLASRQLRFEFDERILADGIIRRHLDNSEIEELIRWLANENIEAVGISLINSYVNAIHELKIGEAISELAPDVEVTLSCDLVPEIGEYVRASTVLANVYVKRIARNYLTRLRNRLGNELGIQANLHIMQSDGGLCEIAEATNAPVRLIESGPAGGALAAAYFGNKLNSRNLIAFDMGGTTAKASVIADGAPLIASEFEVDRQYLFKKHSGLPVKMSVIEMIEIGTGGGSIAKIDAMGRLQVGPQSAGADPGPASYGLGGTHPTVTDANLILGYLDPEFFLGGTFMLDMDAAKEAIKVHVADKLNISIIEAAWGIHQMANESMASATRIHTIERGKNAELFPIFATGGAGPVHAYGMAGILHSPRIIYPMAAGVMSAIGFLTAPLKLSFARSLPGRLDTLNWRAINTAISDMKVMGENILGRTVPRSDIKHVLYADMRYVKQGFTVRVPLADGLLTPSRLPDLQENFSATYQTVYGHSMCNVPIEVVTWRVISQAPSPEPDLRRQEHDQTSLKTPALKGYRNIYLSAQRQMESVPVYDRYLLPAGVVLSGPAIIEERESTVVVNDLATIKHDGFGNLVIDRPEIEMTGAASWH